MGEHPRVPPAQGRLELAELGRLESARGLQPIAKAGVLDRGERLQHVELADDRLEDRPDPAQRVDRLRTITVNQGVLSVQRLLDQQLEPQLVDLVDDDEQQLVMLVRARMLSAQDVARARGTSCR